MNEVQVTGLSREDEPVQRLLRPGLRGRVGGGVGRRRLAARQPAAQQPAGDADGLLNDRLGGALELPGVQGDAQRPRLLDGVGDAALAEQGGNFLFIEFKDGRLGARFPARAESDLRLLGMLPEGVKSLQPGGVVAPAGRQHLLGGVEGVAEQRVGLGQVGDRVNE